MRRNRKEEDLRENHPYFDCPMFFVPRESRFRRVCQQIVNARYICLLSAIEAQRGVSNVQYKLFQNRLVSRLLLQGIWDLLAPIKVKGGSEV